MKNYLGYIRVSTKRQGEEGVSLPVQQAAIKAYAQAHNLSIGAWFEEERTAAKRGRREFNRLLDDLRCGRAQGVIMHKIDRSARNLRDWIDLVELMDQGVDIRFVQDGLDLTSRGGRLAANLQAVIAADYIKNLSDEASKGLYGRLDQGIYPFGAPVGYCNTGKGNPKSIDPIMGPLAAEAFRLYATAEWSFTRLVPELARQGLRNHRGHSLDENALTRMFNNPFYVGLLRVKGRTFVGKHERLISQAQFDAVQSVLRGRSAPRFSQRHAFTFRQRIRCVGCQYHLTGERQKQRYVYYRCHTQGCLGANLTEPVVSQRVADALILLKIDEPVLGDLRDFIEGRAAALGTAMDSQIASTRLNIAQCDDRIGRLTDALVEGRVNNEAFDTRNAQLLHERATLRERLERIVGGPTLRAYLENYLERSNSAYLGFQTENPEARRAILKTITSNLQARSKNLEVTLVSPYREIAEKNLSRLSGLNRDDPRTFAEALYYIMESAALLEIAQEVPDVPTSPLKDIGLPPALDANMDGFPKSM